MSEVTRAEQLAETLEAKAAGQKNSVGDYWGDWVCRDAAAELRRLSAVEAELDTERIRLAACGVVALSDTPESAVRARDMLPLYRSASCDDVARRVDECMSLRATVARQSELIQQAKEAMEGLNALGHVMAEYAYLDKGIGTSTTNGRAWLALRAALSAINEWEKSNG